MGVAVMASLAEFLRTGHLGELHGGLAEERVHTLLGPPESIARSRNKVIWKYGSLQLYFYWSLPDGVRRLITIGLYPRGASLDLPAPVQLEDWSPDAGMTPEDFRRFIEKAAPELLDTASPVPTDHMMELRSSARVSFDSGRLYSISYTMFREPDFEQVTVNVPRADMEAIRHEAAALGLSVSKLCSRWIAERAASLQPT
jgi:hypothetical protein